MKEIILVPDPPFYNSVDVAVLDFIDSKKETTRQRCKITVEFAEVDVRQLQNRGLDYSGAVEYYKDWIYNVVKVHLSQDWECIQGMDEVMVIIRESLKRYYFQA